MLKAFTFGNRLTSSLVRPQATVSSSLSALNFYPSAYFFSTRVSPLPKQDPAEDSTQTEESTPFRLQRPNIFRSGYLEKTLENENNFKADTDSFKATSSSSGYNVGLAAFYSLPKLDKQEGESILEELRSDMDQ